MEGLFRFFVNVSLEFFIDEGCFKCWLIELPDSIKVNSGKVFERLDSILSGIKRLGYLEELEQLTFHNHFLNYLRVGFLKVSIMLVEQLQIIGK